MLPSLEYSTVTLNLRQVLADIRLSGMSATTPATSKGRLRVTAGVASVITSPLLDSR